MVSIVKKYLVKSHYSDLKEDFEELFFSHPNYPSLYAITDSLGHLSIENLAVKIPKEQFIQLPEYFLAIYEEELVLAKKENLSILIETEKGTKSRISSDTFLKGWNQIVVIVEPNSDINNFKIKNSYSKWLLYSLPVVLLVLLSILLLHFSIYSFSLLGLTLIGLIVSVLILQEKFGIKTEIGSKLCNVSSKASCDSVIKSDRSKIFKGLSFYDLPILFFGINFLSLLIDPVNSSLLIGVLSVISIPFLSYSIWLQKVSLKKWCFLCLAISFIILIQGIISFLQPVSFTDFIFHKSFTYIQSSILIISGWFLIKPILEKEIQFKGELSRHKRFKRNFKVFKSFVKKIEFLDGFEKLKGIQYGDINAPVSLTLFLSPSCGHCHKAFKDALDFFQKNQNKVFLNILFNVNPENKGNEYLSVLETLLITNTSDQEMAKTAINDWYVKKMSLKDWKEKWSLSTYDMIVNNQTMKQYEWCSANKFNFTPVKIVNGELFPNEYEISDLNYFINDYIESNDELNSNENLQIV